VILEDEGGLRFGLSRDDRLYFKCRRCRTCCNNKRIVPDRAEIERLAARLGLPEAAFRSSFLEPADGTIRLRPNGDCVFLDERGCGVHPARPLVCRLFPLGLIWDDEGRERFGLMPLHPDCLGYLSDEGTVEELLEAEGANPGLAAERAIRMKMR
jgi:Fe-S-cluster containining protein